jgi:heme A synthase
MGFQYSGTQQADDASPTVLSDKQGIGDVLAVGFGTAVAMWGIGYICRLPGVSVTPQVVLPLLLACLVAGGFIAGRYSHRGWRAGLYSGLVTALLDLLVLGSLATEGQSAQMKRAALAWLAGFFGMAGTLAAAGALAGAWTRPTAGRTVNWKAAFAWVAVAAIGLLIMAGGLVTGFNAGLAVPDWPTSFQMNMFMLPLSRMTGGVFFEHTHRLLGALLGFTSLTLAIYLLWADTRGWIKALAWGAGCVVAVQAVLGGARVVDKSRELAIVHGVLAQLILGTFVAVGVFCARGFTAPQPATRRPGAAMDHGFSQTLVVLLAVQLLLGSMVRHESWLVLMHILMAGVVTLLVLVVGMRAVLMNDQLPVLRWLGGLLLALVLVQVLAGITALTVGGYGDLPADKGPQPTVLQALVTTLHQTNGAALLACAVALALWSRRLLVEPDHRDVGAATVAPQVAN